MIVRKLNDSYKPLIVAVFLVVAGFAAKPLFFATSNGGTLQVRATGDGDSHFSVTTPILVGVAQGAEIVDSGALTEAPDLTLTAEGGAAIGSSNVVSSPDASIQDPGQPVGPVIDPTVNTTYTVRKGDTLSTIAAHFGVSVASIMTANPNLSKKVVKIGESIIIPGTAPATGGVGSPASTSLPNFNKDFILPAHGYNLCVLDSNNGIDITNACGTQVVAAADGIVVPDPNNSDVSGAWNGGYGNFVLIQQAFGNDIYTRYSHLQQATVQIGNYVKQGQQIGLMGNSGGAANCELNFQVVGAQNPFAK